MSQFRQYLPAFISIFLAFLVILSPMLAVLMVAPALLLFGISYAYIVYSFGKRFSRVTLSDDIDEEMFGRSTCDFRAVTVEVLRKGQIIR